MKKRTRKIATHSPCWGILRTILYMIRTCCFKVQEKGKFTLLCIESPSPIEPARQSMQTMKTWQMEDSPLRTLKTEHFNSRGPPVRQKGLMFGIRFWTLTKPRSFRPIEAQGDLELFNKILREY